MLFSTKNGPRKKRSTRKKTSSVSLMRIFSLLLLLLVLAFSVCTAGYVIFFRTVLV